MVSTLFISSSRLWASMPSPPRPSDRAPITSSKRVTLSLYARTAPCGLLFSESSCTACLARCKARTRLGPDRRFRLAFSWVNLSESMVGSILDELPPSGGWGNVERAASVLECAEDGTCVRGLYVGILWPPWTLLFWKEISRGSSLEVRWLGSSSCGVTDLSPKTSDLYCDLCLILFS